jgi:phosphotransferase system enzyme I (PtsI)
MRPRLELKGQMASAGLALGPLVVLRPESGLIREAGDGETERQALTDAIERAIGEIEQLISANPGDAAAMLEFQVAMLSDPALTDDALARIAAGAPADQAWRKALDAHAGGYETAADSYFRARASDFRDVRDRVLGQFLTNGTHRIIPAGAIILATDLPPSRFLEHDWSGGGGIALTEGSASSHVAMLARAQGVPMIVGIAGLPDTVEANHALLDAAAGRLVLSPEAAEVSSHRAAARKARAVSESEQRVLSRPARTLDGTRVEVLINVAVPADVDRVDAGHCDGIGLMRSEFLFRDGSPLPDEERQYEAYRHLIVWAAGKPVTVRTLDIGGDKPVRGLTVPGESNPFLGSRGVRLTLSRPEVFKVQLRALARAAALGPLKVMLPMVSVPDELEQSRELLESAVSEVQKEGRRAALPQLGIMVEVPAVAITPEPFKAAAFFSIGSNDLTQYVMAAARDSASLDRLCDPGNPAVLGLIRNSVRAAGDMGIPVSLCGDIAGDERFTARLLRLGLRNLSVAPSMIGRVKAAIARVDLAGDEHDAR